MRQRQRKQRFLGAVMLSLCLALAFAGCRGAGGGAKTDAGGAGEGTYAERDFWKRRPDAGSGGHQQAQNVYQVEYKDIAGYEADFLLFSPQITQQGVYFKNSASEIYGVSFGEEAQLFAQKLPITLAEGEFLRCFATREGENFYCLVKTADGEVQCRRYDRQGELLESYALDERLASAAQALVPGTETLYIRTADNTICKLDSSGRSVQETQVSQLFDLVAASDDTLYLTYQAGLSDMVLARLDPQTFSLEQLGVLAGGSGYLYLGQDNTLFTADAGYLYRWNLADGSCIAYLEWVENYLTAGAVRAAVQTSDGNLWILPAAADELWFLRQITREEKALYEGEKEEIAVLAMGDDTRLQEVVVAYNKQSKRYHATLEYLTYAGLEDVETIANVRLSGKDSPDILMLEYTYYTTYARAGVLENLLPYMERSDTLCEENFISSAIEAFRTADGIYAIPKTFLVKTLGGRKTQLQEALGGAKGWSTDAFLDYLERYPGVKLEWDGDPMGVVQFCLWLDMERFLEEGFRGAAFSELVRRAGNVQCETARSDAEWKAAQTGGERVLDEFLLYDFFSLPRKEMQYQEEVLLTGYPNREGALKTILFPGNIISMLKRSRHKEGAWDFISYYLQSQPINNTLPADKISFLEQLQALTEKPGGEEKEALAYYYDEESRTSLPIYALKEAQVQKLLDAVESAQPVQPEVNDIINAILWEELPYYFYGDKELGEVLDIIDRRAKLYLAE